MCRERSMLYHDFEICNKSFVEEIMGTAISFYGTDAIMKSLEYASDSYMNMKRFYFMLLGFSGILKRFVQQTLTTGELQQFINVVGFVVLSMRENYQVPPYVDLSVPNYDTILNGVYKMVDLVYPYNPEQGINSLIGIILDIYLSLLSLCGIPFQDVRSHQQTKEIKVLANNSEAPVRRLWSVYDMRLRMTDYIISLVKEHPYLHANSSVNLSDIVSDYDTVLTCLQYRIEHVRECIRSCLDGGHLEYMIYMLLGLDVIKEVVLKNFILDETYLEYNIILTNIRHHLMMYEHLLPFHKDVTRQYKVDWGWVFPTFQ